MSLEKYVQAYADHVGNPVIVFDRDFRVAAFSVHDSGVDSTRLNIILSQKGSVRARSFIREYDVGRADGTVRIPATENGAPERRVAALRHEGRLTGYLSYVPEANRNDAERNDVEDTLSIDPAVLAELRGRIALFLAAMELGGTDDEATAQLLSQLLHGTESARSQAARDIIDTAIIPVAPGYSVLVIAAEHGVDIEAPTLQFALNRALTTAPLVPALKSSGAVINGEACAIMPYGVERDRLDALLQTAAFSRLRVGTGGRVSALEQVSGSYRQARVALRSHHLDHDQPRAAHWDALGLDRLLFQLPLDSVTLEDMPDTTQALLSTTSGPDLAHTVETYLDCGCDAQRTAEVLHLHRSTLYYRLNRAHELADIDLADGITRRELHTSLRIATLAGLRR